MGTSKFHTARQQIKATVLSMEDDIFKQVDLSHLLAQKKDEWQLPKSMNGPAFTRKLVEAKILREFQFPFPHRSERRYAKPNVPMLEVLQSLKSNSYYTHAFAMRIHGILTSPLQDILINFEQSTHERGELPEQTRIDAAFKSNPRTTNNRFSMEDRDIIMLNGMQTGALGVEHKRVELPDLEPANIRFTDLERTLIDITVRPYYATGVEAVLRAFDLARGRVELEKLSRYLTKLNYVYPFHQAIGWYMEKSGYSDAQLKAFRSLPRPRRFYLTHKMGTSTFNENWHIYVPSHMD